ncbi:MAG: hypothetical protein ACE5KO_06275, partial [Candidatus Bathyarchaeia archaeon]
MRYKFFLAIILLFVTLIVAPAHAHVEGSVEKTLGGFKVEFAADPKFPVESQEAVLLFSVQNATTETDLTNFRADITVSK